MTTGKNIEYCVEFAFGQTTYSDGRRVITATSCKYFEADSKLSDKALREKIKTDFNINPDSIITISKGI